MGESRGETSRRGFMQGLAAAVGVTVGGQPEASAEGSYPATNQPPREFDFTQQSPALQADRVVDTACQFCNCLCGLKVHLKAGRIIDVKGVFEDPVQSGGLCVKADMMTEIAYSRERLKQPLVRVGGAKGSPKSQFQPVAWDDALERIARKFLSLRDEGQAHTIANRTSGRLPRGVGSLVNRFFTLLGSPNDTDVGPVCNDAGGNALAWTFGLGNFTNGYGVDPATGKEDLGSAKCFLFFGTNQAETHPVTFAHLLRCREQTKAKLIVVDPRKTPTAAYADRWIGVKPHTDLAFVLGMLHHLIVNDLYDKAFVRNWVVGFDELKRHLIDNSYTPQWAAGVCDVPESVIRETAEQYAAVRPAAIFCNAGVSHQLSAFDTYRALAFLAAITGNIGIPGGGCNFMHNTWPGDLHLPPLPVETPAKREALPVGPDYFAEAILTGRPYPLRALVTEGNPLVSSANTAKVRQAFEKLEFYVYTGLFMEEAAYYADVILPVCSGFEMETVYMRRDDRAIRWQSQVLPRVGQSKPDWEIWIDLAAKMEELDGRTADGYWSESFPQQWKDYSNLWQEFVRLTPAMGGMTKERLAERTEPLRWPCPSPSHPGVSTLYLDHPTWYEAVAALGIHERKRFLTPSGKVEIYTEELESKLAPAGHHALPAFYTHPEVTGAHPALQLENTLVPNPIHPHALTPAAKIVEADNRALHEQFPLMGVVGRPSVVHFASITHWTPTGKRLNGVRFIQIHPDAAKQFGVKDGGEVVVESPRGSVRGTALLWEGIRPDCIFVPNTFGPMQSEGDGYGLERYEPANVLLDDRNFDNLSGQQAYKCFACRVRKSV